MTKLHAALGRIDQLARREMDRSGAPGLSLALTSREHTIYVATYRPHRLPTGGGNAFAGHYRCHNPWMTNDCD